MIYKNTFKKYNSYSQLFGELLLLLCTGLDGPISKYSAKNTPNITFRLCTVFGSIAEMSS